jgi:CDP-6-deoxy-D-xylo-4-hexulose-3-dehydrase
MTDNTELLGNIEASIAAYCEQNHNFDFDQNNPVVRLHEPTFGTAEITAALQPMLTTFVTMGKKVRGFEERCGPYFDCDYSVMNNSGSSANLLAIAAITNKQTENCLQPGDEVIVPALTWSTTIFPLIQLGLVPVLIDCDPTTFNINLNKAEECITEKTRAIMPVHVYGNPCDMDDMMSFAKKHNLQVIEDCCEAMGAEFKGKKVGSFGRVGTFSLYFSHHITALEGGICVTSDFELTESMRIMRAHGWSREADSHDKYVAKYPDIDPRFIFVNLGYNLRPTEVQAAMGDVQLPKLEGFIDNRREAATDYRNKLDKYSDFFHFQEETPNAKHVWFGFPIVLKTGAPFSLADITSHLQTNKIETRPIIAGNIARHPVMKEHEHRTCADMSEADNIMQNGFAFGCHHGVNQAARDYVVSQIDSFMKAQGISQAA